MDRRTFLATVLAGHSAIDKLCGEPKHVSSLTDEVGVTTSSFSGHLTAKPKRGQFTLLELPRILRDELGMKVIDLNTSSLASQERKYLERVREAATKAGCVLTNLKMNQRGLDLSSNDRALRDKALTTYKQSIDAAAILGCRWARPLPTPKLVSRKHYVESYRALADYAAKKKIEMLVENYGWMSSDSKSVSKLIREVGRNVAACPDTGNWSSNPVRYEGLADSFPLAVTCDFKARELGAKGEHKLYDLHRCFEIGRKAGFRGPWCLEHANRNRRDLFRELVLLRDGLRKWSKEKFE